MRENCLEIIYFVFTSWMKKVITSNGEVLHCLLMVSPEKHRKENPNVSRKGNVVIANVFHGCVLCLFLPVWVRWSSYRLILVQTPRTRMPAGLGGTQKEKAGSWVSLGLFLWKRVSCRVYNVFLYLVREHMKCNWKKSIPALILPFPGWLWVNCSSSLLCPFLHL